MANSSTPSLIADALLTDTQVSDLIGVTTTTLATWRSTGRYDLPYLKIGKLVRYRLGDVQSWLDSRRVTVQ